MSRAIVTACLVTLTSFAVAGPARAATVSFDGGGLHVIGDDREDNIRVSLSGNVQAGSATFTVDRPAGGPFGFGAGTPLTAGSGCTQTSSSKVDCAGVNVALAEIRLAGGDDQITHIESAPFDASIFLGDGDDEVTAGVGTNLPPTGFDLIRGEAGNDVLDGSAGNDRIEGGPGNDRLLGGGGTDDLRGDAGDDTLRGDSTTLIDAANQTEAPLVRDTLDGGDGTDTADYSGFNRSTRFRMNSSSAVTGGRLVTPGGIDTEGDGFTSIENLVGGKQRDDVVGTDAANVIDGREGDDLINAGGGNDIVIGDMGSDDLTGGGGNDQLYGGNQAVLSRTTPPAATTGDGNDSLTGGAGNDDIYGDLGVDTLRGNEGSDELYSRDGIADTLSCGSEPNSKTAIFSITKLRVTDYAQVDLRDPNPGDCETFDNTPKDEDPSVVIGTAKLTVGARGTVSVRLSCPSATARGCKGRLDARLSRGTKTKAPGGRPGASYSLARGKAKRVTAKLPAKDLRALTAAPGRAATLQLTSKESGDDGLKTVVRLAQVKYRR